MWKDLKYRSARTSFSAKGDVRLSKLNTQIKTKAFNNKINLSYNRGV
jgi:hypothetical protein